MSIPSSLELADRMPAAEPPLGSAHATGRVYPCLTPGLYLIARQQLLESDPDAQRLMDWTLRDTTPPATPEALACEITWIILCAGRTAQSARTIERKVLGAIRGGRPVVSVFGHRARAAAIERAWAEREKDFAALQVVLGTADLHALIEWCGSLPGVGAVTRFQLAKNFGAPVVKPDLWLSRFAGIADKERVTAEERFRRCQSKAEALSRGTGDPVPLVDSICWLAGNKGVLRLAYDGDTAGIALGFVRRGSIFSDEVA